MIVLRFLMVIGIDPTVDFACKRVLGSPEHPAITLHFLNAVLRLPTPIHNVRILNPVIEKEFEDDKWSLLDILASDEQGRLYDIEVQTTRPLGLRQRLAYYAAPSDNRVIRDPVEQWLYFLCRAEESTAEELAERLPDPVFTEATGVLEMIARNPEERRLYDERLKMERDERARNLQSREEGRQEGREEGQMEGLKKGWQEGAMMGRIQVLQELNGLPPQSADDLAGRTAEELLALEAKLQQKLRDRG